MSEFSPNVLVLDIPVPHKGYIDLLNSHSDGSIDILYLLGKDLLESLRVPKEIRANDPDVTRRMLKGLEPPFGIEILGLDGIQDLPRYGLLTARDEVSRRLRAQYFPDAEVIQENIFLRWDVSNVTADRMGQFDRETSEAFHKNMIRRTKELADESSDWWRRVGVVVVREGQILIEAYNRGFPSENSPYIDGNPRDHIPAGTLGFLAGTLHAEQTAIARARGISLEGSDLYLNSYPCHSCAAMMGEAGIARCFFSGGNAYLNVEETLHAAGIEAVFVRDINR